MFSCSNAAVLVRVLWKMQTKRKESYKLYKYEYVYPVNEVNSGTCRLWRVDLANITVYSLDCVQVF